MSLKEQFISGLHTEEDFEKAAQDAIDASIERGDEAQALRIGRLASSPLVSEKGVLGRESAQKIQSEAFASQPEVLGVPAVGTPVEVQQVQETENIDVRVVTPS